DTPATPNTTNAALSTARYTRSRCLPCGIVLTALQGPPGGVVGGRPGVAVDGRLVDSPLERHEVALLVCVVSAGGLYPLGWRGAVLDDLTPAAHARFPHVRGCQGHPGRAVVGDRPVNRIGVVRPGGLSPRLPRLGARRSEICDVEFRDLLLGVAGDAAAVLLGLDRRHVAGQFLIARIGDHSSHDGTSIGSSGEVSVRSVIGWPHGPHTTCSASSGTCIPWPALPQPSVWQIAYMLSPSS